MNLNPDPRKQGEEVFVSRKLLKVFLLSKKLHELLHPKLYFSDVDILQIYSQKHLGVALNSQLTYMIILTYIY